MSDQVTTNTTKVMASPEGNNTIDSPFSISNIRLFLIFRILFNARFYYPVFTVLFLDFGLTLEQFAILNSVWAASIVLIEVPSGALADTLGRRNLLRVAAILMFLEIALIAFLPLGNNSIVFWGFLINRILSGAAEACASGADEALAYDSLQSIGKSHLWPKVLAVLMRTQSIAFIVALLLGSFIYDANSLNYFFKVMGSGLLVSPQQSMRFPLYLMLLSSAGVLVAAFSMQEISGTQKSIYSDSVISKCFASAKKILDAASWIYHSSAAVLIICSGLIFDSVIRMILTLNSQYYRVIELPAWSFGMAGASFSVIGLFIPKLAGKMVQTNSAGRNLIILALLCFVGLLGMTFVLPFMGLIPFGIVFSVMYMLGYMLSHYLNQITPSEMRATVLSFKGLAFNLAYGFIGLLYSFLAHEITESTLTTFPELGAEALNQRVFSSALRYFPWYFLIIILSFIVICLAKNRYKPNPIK